jgi:hypothetical protein
MDRRAATAWLASLVVSGCGGGGGGDSDGAAGITPRAYARADPCADSSSDPGAHSGSVTHARTWTITRTITRAEPGANPRTHSSPDARANPRSCAGGRTLRQHRMLGRLAHAALRSQPAGAVSGPHCV